MGDEQFLLPGIGHSGLHRPQKERNEQEDGLLDDDVSGDDGAKDAGPGDHDDEPLHHGLGGHPVSDGEQEDPQYGKREVEPAHRRRTDLALQRLSVEPDECVELHVLLIP